MKEAFELFLKEALKEPFLKDAKLPGHRRIGGPRLAGQRSEEAHRALAMEKGPL